VEEGGGGGVQLGPLGMWATSWRIVLDPGWFWGWKIWWNDGWRGGNRSTRRKPALVPLCPPQVPHDLTGRKPGLPRWEASN
jgi:hypothetical protein